MVLKSKVLSVFFVLLGNLLNALTIAAFLIPANLVVGGTTGIALVVNNIFNIPISAFVLFFNIVMLIIGYLILGKKFALTTVLSSFAYPIFLEFWQRIIGDYVITNDIVLATIFSGIGIGVSLGIVIRQGASTGGMDIPPLVLNKFFNIPVSVSLYLFDFLIVLAQIFTNNPDKVLYGIILAFIYSITLDSVLVFGTTKIEVQVISSKHEEINNAIIHKIDRGSTILYGEGGYLHKDTKLVFSIISNRELPLVEKIIHEIDPEAFMIVSRVTQVSGRGFSISKEYK